MDASHSARADFSALIEKAEAEFQRWALKGCEQRDSSVRSLQAHTSFGGWALSVAKVYEDFLDLAVRKRIECYGQVANSSRCWEMLAKACIDDYRNTIMTSVRHVVQNLRNLIDTGAKARGNVSPAQLAALLIQVQHLEGITLNVVNAELAVLEADGKLAAITEPPETPRNGFVDQGIAEGTMSEPEFWPKAADSFRRLQPSPPRPGEVQHYSDNGLCAYWYDDGFAGGPRWRLGNAGEQRQLLFRYAAESAAVRLGHVGGESALPFWLDRLKREGLFYKLAPGGGEIYRVCDASAEYCLKCETDERAKRRKGTPERDEKKAAERQAFIAPHIAPTPRKTTLNGLSEKIGIEQSSISRWCNGRQKLSSANVGKLAEYLKVKPGDIPN